MLNNSFMTQGMKMGDMQLAQSGEKKIINIPRVHDKVWGSITSFYLQVTHLFILHSCQYLIQNYFSFFPI